MRDAAVSERSRRLGERVEALAAALRAAGADPDSAARLLAVAAAATLDALTLELLLAGEAPAPDLAQAAPATVAFDDEAVRLAA